MKKRKYAKVKWKDLDRWNMDVSLARIISSGIKEIRKTGISYPANLTEEEWRDTLDTIYRGFHGVDSWKKISNLTEEGELDLKLAFDLLQEYFLNLWD